MDYTEVLDDLGCVIEEDLKALLERAAEEGREYHPFIGDVYSRVGEFVMRGGRRLASCTTVMVYRGYRGRVDDGIIRAASGVELFRHAILVHDDIVDAEEERRGGLTLHRLLAASRDERFGSSSALFAGNMLYSMALEAVLQSGFSREGLAKVVQMLSSEYRAVNESQILDLLFEYRRPDVKEWEVMAGRRAASLFRACMLSGAVLAGAPADDRRLLEDAGRQIGYAFDIQDDIIDTFATREQYGRDPCQDISKGKKPLHVVLALEKDGLLAALEGKRLSTEDVERIKEIMRASGALDTAKEMSRVHAREAARLISETEMNGEAKEFFTSLTDFVAGSLEWYS